MFACISIRVEGYVELLRNSASLAGKSRRCMCVSGISRLVSHLSISHTQCNYALRCPPGLGLPKAHILANRMRKLRLAECLSGISVQEAPVARVEGMEGGFGRVYAVTLQFFQ